MSDNTPDKEIVVTVSHAEPDKIVITRKSGDTYTSKSEELIDFFHTADPARYHQSPVAERDERLVWVSEIINLIENTETEDFFDARFLLTKVLRKLKSQSETPSHEGKDAVAFGQYIADNKLRYLKSTSKWTDVGDNILVTTEQLYNLYTESLKQQI